MRQLPAVAVLPAVARGFVVVDAMTRSALLHSVCDLKSVMNMQHSLIQHLSLVLIIIFKTSVKCKYK